LQTVVFSICKAITTCDRWVASNVERLNNALPQNAALKYFYHWCRGDVSGDATNAFFHSAFDVEDSVGHPSTICTRRRTVQSVLTPPCLASTEERAAAHRELGGTSFIRFRRTNLEGTCFLGARRLSLEALSRVGRHEKPPTTVPEGNAGHASPDAQSPAAVYRDLAAS
jgi:hypothetical protein